MEGRHERKGGGGEGRGVWAWKWTRATQSVFMRGSEATLGKDESSLGLGCSRRHLDFKYLKKEIEFLRLITAGRNFGIRVANKQKR